MALANDPEDIVGWQRLDDRITTSGRITAADVARLKAIGVRHVVNLALATSPGAFAEEAEALAAAGLRYTHIPVPFDAPEEAHFERFCEAIEADDAPVHVHCMMNWRVSAFFYRYHRDTLGMPEPAARALMERQWSPETSTNSDAPTWAAFIAPRSE
jgi:uncharacterized protein (TIGR01244 family)